MVGKDCSKTVKKSKSYEQREQISFKKSPRELGPMSMRQVYTSCQSDDKLVKEIMGCKRGVTAAAASSVDLKSMKLKQENIARVLPGRIMTLKFIPSKDLRMVVAGNKFGNVGFWNVDSEDDGIYVYYPHSGPVSGISIHPFSMSKIISSCYDGFIRLLDVEKESFGVAYLSDDEIFCVSQKCDDVKSLFFGEGLGTLGILDGCSAVRSWSLHQDRINTIDFNSQNTNIMATSSADGTACIWDLRKLGPRDSCLNTVKHKKAVHSAYFSPSGTLVATTSIDDKIGLVSGVNYEVESMIDHNNRTCRWISSFRGIWGWDDSFIFVGNVKKGIDVVSAEEKKVCYSLGSPHLSAIPCRFDAHPLMPATLAASTGGGQIYVWDL